jgi:hypothetical protein
MVYMDQLERIKKLAIIAMFSDDDLMDILVLKGGNAIDIVYGIASRSSLDLDFSIATEFNQVEMSSIKSKFEKALNRVFDEAGYRVFDIKFGERPEDSGPDVPPFWGGYRLEFKLIDKTKYAELENDVQRLRLSAVDVGPGAKAVPINLIGNIKEFREYHRPDFTAVENTVKPNIKIKDFDFYFDYVINKCNELLEALGEI